MNEQDLETMKRIWPKIVDTLTHIAKAECAAIVYEYLVKCTPMVAEDAKGVIRHFKKMQIEVDYFLDFYSDMVTFNDEWHNKFKNINKGDK